MSSNGLPTSVSPDIRATVVDDSKETACRHLQSQEQDDPTVKEQLCNLSRALDFSIAKQANDVDKLRGEFEGLLDAAIDDIVKRSLRRLPRRSSILA